MSSLSEVVPTHATISKTSLSQRVFSVCYLIAIVVATFGWISAFAWLSFRLTMWLLT
jgi:hypothetical protein